jgi:transcription elongation factor S-II
MPLDTKGVESKRADLDKAIKNNDPGPNIIGLLTDLRNGVVPSDKLLRDTKIGVVVNRLKMHKDPAVAKLAHEMVTRWKHEMQKQKQQSSGASTPKPGANGTASSPPTGTSASPAPAVKPEKKKFDGDPATRSAVKDKVADSIKCTGDAVRDSCLTLVYNGLAFMSEERASLLILALRKPEGRTNK